MREGVWSRRSPPSVSKATQTLRIEYIGTAAAFRCRRALREKGRVLDFGGCRFDDRHYTRFGRILLAEEGFEGSEEFSGFMQFEAPMSEIDAVVNAILQGKCVVLFGKEGKELAGKFLLLLKGDPAYFRGLGYEKDTLSALSERLG